MSVWSYGYEPVGVRHLGPMAQDFATAFGLGSNDRQIELVDACGVSLAACQALLRRASELEGRIAALEAESSTHRS